MSIETTSTHVSETELAEHLTELLDRVANGERIIVLRDDHEIATISRTTATTSTPPRKAEASANRELAFDDEFVRAAQEFRESLNSPRVAEWPE